MKRRPKQNNMLASFEAKLDAQYRKKLDVALQMGLDAALIAANEVLQLGPTRAGAFRTAYVSAMNEMAALIAEDGADDDDLVYATETIDRRLRQIVGADQLQPWIERYGGRQK